MGGFWHGIAMRLYRAGIGLAAACGHAKARGWLAMRRVDWRRWALRRPGSNRGSSGCGFTVLPSVNTSRPDR